MFLCFVDDFREDGFHDVFPSSFSFERTHCGEHEKFGAEGDVVVDGCPFSFLLVFCHGRITPVSSLASIMGVLWSICLSLFRTMFLWLCRVALILGSACSFVVMSVVCRGFFAGRIFHRRGFRLRF